MARRFTSRAVKSHEVHPKYRPRDGPRSPVADDQGRQDYGRVNLGALSGRLDAPNPRIGGSAAASPTKPQAASPNKPHVSPSARDVPESPQRMADLEPAPVRDNPPTPTREFGPTPTLDRTGRRAGPGEPGTPGPRSPHTSTTTMASPGRGGDRFRDDFHMMRATESFKSSPGTEHTRHQPTQKGQMSRMRMRGARRGHGSQRSRTPSPSPHFPPSPSRREGSHEATLHKARSAPPRRGKNNEDIKSPKNQPTSHDLPDPEITDQSTFLGRHREGKSAAVDQLGGKRRVSTWEVINDQSARAWELLNNRKVDMFPNRDSEFVLEPDLDSPHIAIAGDGAPGSKKKKKDSPYKQRDISREKLLNQRLEQLRQMRLAAGGHKTPEEKRLEMLLLQKKYANGGHYETCPTFREFVPDNDKTFFDTELVHGFETIGGIQHPLLDNVTSPYLGHPTRSRSADPVPTEARVAFTDRSRRILEHKHSSRVLNYSVPIVEELLPEHAPDCRCAGCHPFAAPAAGQSSHLVHYNRKFPCPVEDLHHHDHVEGMQIRAMRPGDDPTKNNSDKMVDRLTFTPGQPTDDTFLEHHMQTKFRSKLGCLPGQTKNAAGLRLPEHTHVRGQHWKEDDSKGGACPGLGESPPHRKPMKEFRKKAEAEFSKGFSRQAEKCVKEGANTLLHFDHWPNFDMRYTSHQRLNRSQSVPPERNKWNILTQEGTAYAEVERNAQTIAQWDQNASPFHCRSFEKIAGSTSKHIGDLSARPWVGPGVSEVLSPTVDSRAMEQTLAAYGGGGNHPQYQNMREARMATDKDFANLCAMSQEISRDVHDRAEAVRNLRASKNSACMADTLRWGD